MQDALLHANTQAVHPPGFPPCPPRTHSGGGNGSGGGMQPTLVLAAAEVASQLAAGGGPWGDDVTAAGVGCTPWERAAAEVARAVVASLAAAFAAALSEDFTIAQLQVPDIPSFLGSHTDPLPTCSFKDPPQNTHSDS